MTEHLLEHYPNPARHRKRIFEILQAGATPVFLGEKAILTERYARLNRALAMRWPYSIIAYSFKTNYLVAESKVLQAQGAWAEVVSGREYRLARQLGYTGDRIVFNGPYKTDDELTCALKEGARLHVNDHEELDRLLGITAAGASPSGIGLRLNCAVEGLAPSRFGFSLENAEAEQAVEKIRASRTLTLDGVHIHLHGDTDDPACYQAACHHLGTFLANHVPQYRRTIRYVDLGGGFPAHAPQPRRRTRWNPHPIEDYVQAITCELETFFPDADKPTLILEPGRYLVGDAICFISQVLSVKTCGSEQRITGNGSITMLPLTHYRAHILQAFSPDLTPRSGAEAPSIIYGPSCREDDILYEGPLCKVHPGDYLIYYAAGAYNSSLSSPGFIFAPPPLVFL